MTWDHRYRMFEEGEIVEEGDETLNDFQQWEMVQHSVGRKAASPLYTSHSIYRRRIKLSWPVRFWCWLTTGHTGQIAQAGDHFYCDHCGTKARL